MYDRKIRFRTPANAVEEIRYLVDRFGVREIHFEDDNLTLRRDRVEAVCEGLIGSRIQASWAYPNGIRADRIDEPLMRLMKRSGCYHAAFGVESASTIERSIESAKHSRLQRVIPDP